MKNPFFSIFLLLVFPLQAIFAQEEKALEYFRKGTESFKKSQFRTAVIDFEEAVKIDSTYKDAQFALGLSHSYLNNYSKAINALRKAKELGFSSEKINVKLRKIYKQEAAQFYLDQRFPDAISSYRELLKINPKDDDAILKMGFSYMKLKDYEKALESFRKTVKINPKNKSAFYAMGNIHLLKRENGLAIQAYEKAISIDSTFVKAYGDLASVHISTKDFEKAVSILEKALEIDSDFSKGYLLLGIARNSLGRQHEAVDPLRRALALEPKNADAHYRLGEAYFAKGDYRDAIESGKNATRLKRNYHAAEQLLGDAYSKLGQIEDARNWYARAMQDSRLRDYCKRQIEDLARSQGQ